MAGNLVEACDAYNVIVQHIVNECSEKFEELADAKSDVANDRRRAISHLIKVLQRVFAFSAQPVVFRSFSSILPKKPPGHGQKPKSKRSWPRSTVHILLSVSHANSVYRAIVMLCTATGFGYSQSDGTVLNPVFKPLILLLQLTR